MLVFKGNNHCLFQEAEVPASRKQRIHSKVEQKFRETVTILIMK